MDLFAQWQKVADIGSMVKSIYFLDEVGRPHIGFAASQRGVVIRTSDRGKTWNSCVFNGNPGGEAIYDFTFKDSLRGWCAGSGLFTTTDGGMTWETVGNHPSISGCYYNRYSKLLFISHALANGKMSPDDGTTWANILPPLMLGFAFVDSLHGISTTYLGLHYYTSDGGYTWNRSEFGSESYQPVAVKGTSSFLSVSEGFIGTNSIYQTNNYGATWAPIYQTGSQSLLTGTIHGSRDTFYVQSNNGMQFTIDRGRSWHFICGPDNYFDNRFWSSGDTVFAGDRTGGVWITNHATSRPENALLAIDPPPPYSLGVSECTELIHSFKVTIADNCEPSQVQIQNIEINGTNNFVLLSPATLPKLVATDESIKIAYRPSTLLFDTASVTITYSQLGTSRETTFNIYGSRIPGGKKVSILPQEIQKNVNNPCQNLDTTIQIKANRCDTLEISSFFLPSGMVFISTPPQLPYYLPPDSILTIPIQASVLASGLFTDTLHLNLKNKDTSFAEQIPLQFSVKNNIPISAMYTPPRMSFGRVSICTTSTKQLKITNNTCANFTITALSWATPSGDVSLSSVFPLPRTLIPGESDSLLILFAPQTIGTKQVTLRVTLERDSVKRDTIISIHAIGTTAVEAFFSDSAAVLEPILTCQSALDTVYISNASCEQVTINEINYDLTKGFTVLSPLLTTTIPPTDSIPVVIHYSSTVGSNVSIPIEFRLRSSTSGIETAATIQAQATTIERGDSVSVLPKVIVFDSTSVCSDASDFFSAKNLSSCDSLLITSVTLDGGDPSFMINPSTSVLLTPGDSIRFPISFSPAEDGWHSTNIIVHFKTRTREWDTVISVGGFGAGKKRIVSCDVTSIDLGKHSICTERDTSLTLRNDGCEPLTISSSIMNGTGFTISGITNPVIIPAKSTHTFPLHSYIDTTGGAVLSLAEIIFNTDGENSLAPITISRSYRYPVTLTFAIECDTSDDPFAPLIKIKVNDAQSLADAALEKLDVKLVFNTDLLEMRKVSGSNTYQMAGISDIEITGSPITCDNEGVIASVKYRSYLSDSTASQIVFSALTPSRGMVALDSCSILMSTLSSSYQRPYECGDSILINSMRYMKPPVSIESLQPNPASSQLKATITSQERDVSISIRNYLGEVVLMRYIAIDESENISLDISSIPEGSYRVEVSNSTSSATKAFVVVR